MITELTDKNFKEEAVDKDGLVIVDFYSPQCGPCVRIAPVLEKMSEKYTIGKYNVKTNDQWGRAAMIRSVPTLIFLQDGEEVHRITGYHTEAQLENIITNIN